MAGVENVTGRRQDKSKETKTFSYKFLQALAIDRLRIEYLILVTKLSIHGYPWKLHSNWNRIVLPTKLSTLFQIRGKSTPLKEQEPQIKLSNYLLAMSLKIKQEIASLCHWVTLLIKLKKKLLLRLNQYWVPCIPKKE